MFYTDFEAKPECINYRVGCVGQLLNILQEQKNHKRDFYDSEIPHQGKISKHDMERYRDGYLGYSLDVLAEASANLGHARVEIAKFYVY